MSRFSESESILTEDFVNKFQDISIPKGPHDDSALGLSHSHPSTKATPTTLSALKKLRSAEDGDESVLTEDFESRFRSYLVKPATSDLDLHDTWKGSEMSIRSQRLKDRVSSMFNIPSDNVRFESSTGATLGLDESQDNDMMDRKIQEILARRKLERESTADRGSRSRTLPRNVRLHEGSEERRQRDSSTDEYTSEIRSRSQQIKREIELERQQRQKLNSSSARSPTGAIAGASASSVRARSGSRSPSRRPDQATPSAALDRKVTELDQLTNSLRRANTEKENMLQEVTELQRTLRKHQAEMRLTEKLIHDNRAKAEDMQTEMSLAEMRRDTTTKELAHLNKELEEKRHQLRDMELKVQSHVNHLQESVGSRLTKVEMDSIIAERDELYRLLRNAEDSESQRFQLERQLTLAKDDLRTEQQKAKDRIQSLEEELDASITKITELLRDRECLREQAQSLERQVRFLEEERIMSQNEVYELKGKYQEEIQRKLEEHEEDRARVHQEIRRIEQQRSSSENELRQQVHELKEIIKTLRTDLAREETLATESRAQVQQLTHDLDASQKGRNEILENMERQLRDKDRELEATVAAVSEKWMQERNELLNQVRRDQEMQNTCVEQRLATEVAHFSVQIKAKDDEISFLKDRLRQMELANHNALEEQRLEIREQLRDALSRERMVWLEEQKAKWSRELSALREETTGAVEAAEDAARQQRERANHLDAMLATMHEELEAERAKNRNATKDKISAIRHLKGVAKEELQREIDRLRTQQSKNISEEVLKLRDQIDFYAKELPKLKQSEDEYKAKVEEQSHLLERLQRTVVQEINEECASIAALLEVNPRKVELKNYNMTDLSGPLNARTSPITAALANLKACGEEVRAMVSDLREQMAEESRRCDEMEDSQRKDLEEIKRELRTEQARKLAHTRERLLHEHLKEIERLSKQPDSSLLSLLKDKERELEDNRRQMKLWKLETAEKLASKLQEEFRKEFERKMTMARAGNMRPMSGLAFKKAQMTPSKAVAFHPLRSSSFGDAAGFNGGAGSLIQQLQERVRQLREENLELKKKGHRSAGRDGVDLGIPRLALSSSNPNLAMSNEELDEIPEREHRPSAMERLEAKVQQAARSARDESFVQTRISGEPASHHPQRRSPSLGRSSSPQRLYRHQRDMSPDAGYSTRASTLPMCS